MIKLVSLLAAWFRHLQGWRRMAVAFGAGFVAALAFPPFNLIPLLWLCFPVLVVLLQGATRVRQAFAIGWSFSFGLLTLSLYWIAGSLFVDIRSFWWALPLAVAGLPACFALYYGLACVLAFKWNLNRVDGVFFLALCWFGAELARAHLFTGFPWDMLGYVWGDVLSVMQSVSLIGIEGLTLLTLFIVVTPALYAMPVTRMIAHAVVSFGLLVFVGMGVAGSLRLMHAPYESVPDVRLRLVQPNIDQSLKWKADQRFKNFNQVMTLSFNPAAEEPITHYIWPETATPYYLTEEPNIRRLIADSMPEGSVLLTGVVRREADEAGDEQRYYNSLIAMDSKGSVVAGYDKHHLVPFGEYMPFRSFVPFPVISTMGRDFTAGDGIRSTRAPKLPPFSGLVCYEAIFSGDVVEKEDRPQFLLNVTNDAWYKGTIGPAQHFSIARARAIEEGLPLVRAANAGVTGVVDPYGRIIASTNATEAGFVDSSLPKSLAGLTPMADHGNFLVYCIGLFSLICLIISRIQRGSSLYYNRT